MAEVVAADFSTANLLEHNAARLLDTARVDAVFGRAVERGEATVIPCAEIAVGFGTGFGTGTGPATSDGATQGGGTGGGMGGGARGRPIAVVVVSRDGVRVEPVVDVTKLALAGLTTLGFTLAWLARLSRAGRRSGAGPLPPPVRLRRALGQ